LISIANWGSNMEQYDKQELLLKFIRGELSPADKNSVQKRLASDPEFRETYGILKELHFQESGANWVQIRKATLKMSMRLYKDFKKSLREPRYNYGIMYYDSKMLPLPRGVRPARVMEHTLKYKVGECDLELSLRPMTTESYEIIGQITGYEKGNLSRVIARSRKNRFESDTDQFNLFRFAKIPLGSYTLDLMDGRKKIGAVAFEI